MIHSAYSTIRNKSMAMQMLSPAILRPRSDYQFLRAYLDEAQVIEYESINADAHKIIAQLTEVESYEGLAGVISNNTHEMQIISNRIARLMLQLVDIEHDDYSRLQEFFAALISGESGLDASLIAFHKNQLDDARAQRLDIAMQEYSYFDHWVLNALSAPTSGPPMDLDSLARLAGDVSMAQYFFSAITQIMTNPHSNPALPILIDAMYQMVADINLVVDENSGEAGLVLRPPQTLATLGYGYGRFEYETDEDVEHFIAILRELRHQKE